MILDDNVKSILKQIFDEEISTDFQLLNKLKSFLKEYGLYHENLKNEIVLMLEMYISSKGIDSDILNKKFYSFFNNKSEINSSKKDLEDYSIIDLKEDKTYLNDFLSHIDTLENFHYYYKSNEIGLFFKDNLILKLFDFKHYLSNNSVIFNLSLSIDIDLEKYNLVYSEKNNYYVNIDLLTIFEIVNLIKNESFSKKMD